MLTVFRAIVIGIVIQLVVPAQVWGFDQNRRASLSGAAEQRLLPSFFEANKGQVAKPIRFISRGRNVNGYIEANKIRFQQTGQTGIADEFSLSFLGGEITGGWNGERLLPGRINFYRGNNAADWVTQVPTFKQLRYSGVYPGIDAILRFSNTQLEYDFILAPGADPNRIRVRIESKRGFSLTDDGRVEIKTAKGRVYQQLPVVYQKLDGQRRVIPTRYRVIDKHTLGFDVAAYELDRPLVIDPVIEFASYWGGTGSDMPMSTTQYTAVDNSEYIYVSGVTVASGNPSTGQVSNKLLVDDNGVKIFSAADTSVLKVTHGINTCDTSILGSGSATGSLIDYDAFFAKISSNGELIFVSYFGGCGRDEAKSIRTDSVGDIYLGGVTDSENFPTKQPLQPEIAKTANTTKIFNDGFVAKFNGSTGALIYSTYLGGNNDDGINSIAIDSKNRVYVVGETKSPTWLHVTTCNLQVSKGRNETFTPCAYKENIANPTKPTADVFVARIGANGDVVSFMHFLGGRDDDFSSALALKEDLQGNVNMYVAGTTASYDFPMPESGPSYRDYRTNTVGCSRLSVDLQRHTHTCRDAFIAILTDDAQNLVDATFVGGDEDESVSQILLDALGNVYIAGITWSLPAYLPDGSPIVVDPSTDAQTQLNAKSRLSRYPVFHQFKLDNSLYVGNNGGSDAFITKLTPDLSELLFSTIVAGSQDELVHHLALVPASNVIYLAGYSRSSDFPTKSALQSQTVEGDGFVIKLTENTDSTLDVIYSSLFGGDLVDKIVGVAPLQNSRLFLVGSTYSTLLQTKSAFQSGLRSNQDFTDISDLFLVALNEGGSSSDLSVAINHVTPQRTYVDSEVQYEITITNNGSADAENIRLAIELPVGGTRKYEVPQNMQCVENFSGYYCALSSLAAGVEAAKVTFRLSFSRPGNKTVKVSIASSISDTSSSNDKQETTTHIVERPSRGFGATFTLELVIIFLFVAWFYKGLKRKEKTFKKIANLK